MLEADIYPAATAEDGVGPGGPPVIVLLHGRGADPSDLAPLRSRLPAAATLVLPRAPHNGLAWGYGPGWAWYRYEGGTRPDPASFEASQHALDELIDRLPERLGRTPTRRVVGGFSQGGTMSLAWALRHPGRADGVLVFSGFLPDHPMAAVSRKNAPATPIWWGHGTHDPAVHHEWAVEGRATLREAGADLEARDYRMGHAISPEELDDAVGWLEHRIGAAGGG